MPKFYGVVGYGDTVDAGDGVWEDVITEVPYYGEVVRNTRHLQEVQQVFSDVTVQNSISIIADAYANEHMFAMRYVAWQGTLWIVSDVEVDRPRLILRLGGRYNGPVPVPVSP